MMRMAVLGALAFGVLACAPPPPQPFDAPVIFVGLFQSETLFGRQTACQAVREERVAAPELAAGWTDLPCVSNACGLGEAEFEVHKVLAGTFDGERGVLRYILGEWCQPEFFPISTPLLVCIYRTDGEHRFRTEPVYRTAEGEVILLRRIKRIGELELASLLKPLPSEIHYGHVSEFDDIGDLMARGLVTIDGENVSAVHGIFLTDLAQELSDQDWRPRRVSTLVPDGLGGYTEIMESERASNGAPALALDKPESHIEIWDC